LEEPAGLPAKQYRLFLSSLAAGTQIMEDKMNTTVAAPKNHGKFFQKTMVSFFLTVALCGFYLLVYSPVPGFCVIYYVDAATGNDTNDGLSSEGARKTFYNINNNPNQFQAGDQILLKRGETWRFSNGTLQRFTYNGMNTALAVRFGGTSENNIVNYITIGDYGDAANKPLIIGDNIATKRSDCVVYIDNDFVQIKNIRIVYSSKGFNQGYTNGKGIRIDKSTNPDTPDTECNILIDACDISNCPENGITIGSNRKYVVIDHRDGGAKSLIYNNGENGICVFYDPSDPPGILSHHISITNCKIYRNNYHGIYLEGDNAVIEYNNIYSNGRDPATLTDPPDHNIYLLGDSGKVTHNNLNYAKNGCGFRYTGSNLILNSNIIKDNFRDGIGFWVDDSNNYYNNSMAGNTIRVTYYGHPNRAIGIGRPLGNSGGFINTTISRNKINGIRDPNTNNYPRGIYLQGCSGVTIKRNTFNEIPSCQIEINGDNPSDFDSKFYSDYNTFNNTQPVIFCADHQGGLWLDFCGWKSSGQSWGWKAYEQNSTNNSGCW